MQIVRDPYSGAGAGKVTITATALVSRSIRAARDQPSQGSSPEAQLERYGHAENLRSPDRATGRAVPAGWASPDDGRACFNGATNPANWATLTPPETLRLSLIAGYGGRTAIHVDPDAGGVSIDAWTPARLTPLRIDARSRTAVEPAATRPAAISDAVAAAGLAAVRRSRWLCESTTARAI